MSKAAAYGREDLNDPNTRAWLGIEPQFVDERERLLLDPATLELVDPAEGGAGRGSGVDPANARRGGMLA